MANNVLIVESGKKIPTISKYLGEEWKVLATGGHIADLPEKGGLGLNKQTLELEYELTDKGQRAIREIRPHVATADRIVLATDLDREGEAIADMVSRELALTNFERARFAEITETEIIKELNNTSSINYDLVNAQTARRILDRVMGWEGTAAVSDYAGNDIYPMGRVQSQTVAIIARRDEIIDNFKPTNHYGIKAEMDGWYCELDVKKSRLGNEIDDTFYWQDKAEVDDIIAKTKSLTVDSYEVKQVEKYANVAFSTSTMHQVAFSKLGFDSKKTDALANSLFEKGHITYIRTDSTYLSQDGYDMVVAYANAHNLPLASMKRDGKKGVVAQEAHEAVRFCDVDFDGTGLSDEEKQLYDLIFGRTIASQLAPSIYETTNINLSTEIDGKTYYYSASSSKLVDKGFLAFYASDDEEDENADDNEDEKKSVIPKLAAGEKVDVISAKSLSKTTKPPGRFNEGSLGKYLEQNGIGRPSTWSKIYEKIIEHGYVERVAKKGGGKATQIMVSTAKGKLMVKATGDVFSIMEEAFTRKLEKELDDVANGLKDYKDVVFDFFDTLDKEIKVLAGKPSIIEQVKCEKCGDNMRRLPSKQQKGKYFWLCRNTECKYSTPEINGRPLTLAEREDRQKQLEENKRLAYNEDGTAKYHCVVCQSSIERKAYAKEERKGEFFWRCTSDNVDLEEYEECNKFYNEDVDKKAPFLSDREYQIKQATNPDGTPKNPCAACGGVLIFINPKDKKKNSFFKCMNEKCNKTYNVDEKGKPTDKKSWEIKAESRSIDKNGKYKWHCKKCNSPVFMYDKKDGGTYKKCTNKDCLAFYNDDDDKKGGQGNKGGSSPSGKPKKTIGKDYNSNGVATIGPKRTIIKNIL